MRKPFRFIIKSVKSPFKKLKLLIKDWAGWLGIPKIVLFRGYANEDKAVIMGTVMEDKGLTKPSEKDSIFKNMLGMIKRYASDELPFAEVEITFQGQTQTVTAGENGIFRTVFDLQPSWEKQKWVPVEAKLVNDMGQGEKTMTGKGEVLFVDQKAEFAIISDIDDTVLVSYSTSFMKKMRLMLMKNAATRSPFEGVTEFYQALKNGITPGLNPLFFISSSEWNLYDLLEDFAEYNNIPKAVFLLRELEVSMFKFWKSGGGSHDHKIRKITKLLEFYKETKFILIGDSGQQDPELYLQIIKKHPERILYVYIRDLSARKRKRLQEIKEECEALGVQMLALKTTHDAWLHAVEKKLITAEEYSAAN